MKKKLIVGKKGQGVFEQLSSMAIALVSVAIVLVVGFLIIAQAQTQVSTIETVENGTAFNATVSVQQALDDIPPWLPIIIVTFIGSILIGMVKLFRRSSGG